MTILVTGSTGKIGTELIQRLASAGGAIRALTRAPERARLPAGAQAAAGELLDVEAMRRALDGVSTLFLLAPNAPDELTRAMVALGLAREAGVKGIVYLSVYRGTEFADVPHFASKVAVERMIEADDLPATILRPAYFMQNDLAQKEALSGGIYGSPAGERGISMVDIRDIADAAAAELLRREQAAARLPRNTYALVGPDKLTGASLAALWSQALAREVRYAGSDLDTFEQRLRASAPDWLAYDMRQMMRRYQEDGATADASEIARLSTLLGHPPRSYAAFAEETARAWATQTDAGGAATDARPARS